MIFWILAKEVNILKREVNKDDDEWGDVMVDLPYYRNVKDLKIRSHTERSGRRR